MSDYWLLENTTDPQVAATPTFAPAAGGYVQPVSVTISDATPGATIYYTTNGVIPTTASTVYSAPIALAVGNTTIQAIAVAAGFTNSSVGSATYGVSAATPPPPPPIAAAAPLFSLPGGGYAPPISITLADLTPGATIYYTLDGSIPTTGSTLYSGAIVLPSGATTTINAIATAPTFAQSTVASATYVIATPAPPPPPPPVGSPIRVQATQAGFFNGDWKDIGDVFDITDPSQFSDSTQSQVPVGNPDYPIYGWMTIVPSSTPLFSYASTGQSTPRNAPRRTVL